MTKPGAQKGEICEINQITDSKIAVAGEEGREEAEADVGEDLRHRRRALTI